MRWKTREVMVGNVGVGGNHPIRIQSMTTSNTRDVEATVGQIIRLADAGCEIARVTVQGMKEAEACEGIKNELIKKGYSIPLVADIHFYPPAAMKVADSADKVRINPGNFVDKRASFKILEYDNASYAKELERIEEKFAPLVEKCKKLKRAMRIGTNHGSLSDRIMNRFGDTPRGMVESALEFTRVARKMDYHDIIFSMKSSHTQVMIEAYRLLVEEMKKLGWDYPLHLGVTEAGEGEDGRIKSSIGIGTLLLEGIGDTIRVSLTEDPWFEIDPCKRLVKLAENYKQVVMDQKKPKKRMVIHSENKGVHRDGTVVLRLSASDIQREDLFAALGCKMQLGYPVREVGTVDMVVVDKKPEKAALFEKAKIRVVTPEMGDILFLNDKNPQEWEKLLSGSVCCAFFCPEGNRLTASRQFFQWLQAKGVTIPVILQFCYTCSQEDLVIHAAAEFGSLLSDGLGEGICLMGDYPLSLKKSLSFGILQGARLRLSKTEFISCPGCGRTLFELQQVAEKIRKRTGHLPGVKIAIMGCIVNGPGEMADADFGYVGSKPGKIDLYVGKQCVERDIAFADAEERLVSLIKTHGRWIEQS